MTGHDDKLWNYCIHGNHATFDRKFNNWRLKASGRCTYQTEKNKRYFVSHFLTGRCWVLKLSEYSPYVRSHLQRNFMEICSSCSCIIVILPYRAHTFFFLLLAHAHNIRDRKYKKNRHNWTLLMRDLRHSRSLVWLAVSLPIIYTWWRFFSSSTNLMVRKRLKVFFPKRRNKTVTHLHRLLVDLLIFPRKTSSRF